jgi:hypothetical protein
MRTPSFRRLQWNPARATPVALLALAPLLTGCVETVVVDEYRQSPTSVMSGDTVVVLGRRHSTDHETEEDFISCVGTNLSEGKFGFNVIPEKQFVDALYPWFETSTAPMDVKYLRKMLENESVARKFADFGVRYFVWIDGSTETTDKSGSISCAIGPGGGGCFGFATWDDEASYEASIWDFKSLELSGKISTEAEGTSYLPAVIIPIPLLARVQASACRSMAAQLSTFISGTGTRVAGEGAAPAADCGAGSTC